MIWFACLRVNHRSTIKVFCNIWFSCIFAKSLSWVLGFTLFTVGSNFIVGGVNNTFFKKIRDTESRDYYMELNSKIDTDLIIEINDSHDAVGVTTFEGSIYHFENNTVLNISIIEETHSFEDVNLAPVHSGTTTAQNDGSINAISTYTYNTQLPDAKYLVQISGINKLGYNVITEKEITVDTVL